MNKLTIFAGPCVIESEEIVMKIAKELDFLAKDERVDFYFKASFDKANRTSLDSFRGVGFDEGLRILQKVKDEFGYKLVTDVHESHQAQPVSKVVDVLQIPAFLCRQTDLLVECAKTNCKINIKKAQFLSAEAMKHPALKVLKTRNCDDVNYEKSAQNGLWLCERGNMYGYSDLVVDMKNLVALRQMAPVIFDATHSAQKPSSGSSTDGNSAIVPYLARGAAAVGVDGFFFETHFDPSIANSDGANMLKIDELKKLIKDIFAIRGVLENE
jgi:2-dehydro-3-deoxyphosphooctonate aldolase (KDO 8-P synthase)